MFMGKKARAKNVKGTLRRIWDYLRKDVLRLVLVSVLVLIGSGVNIAGPVLMGKAIDAMAVPLMAGSSLTRVDFQRLLEMVVILAGTYVVGSIAAWGQIWMMVQVAQNAVRNLRKDLFSRIQQLPLRYFDATPHGELMSRLTNDVENLNNVLTNNATQLISSGAVLFGTFTVMLLYSPILTLFTVVTVPIGLFITNKISKHTRKYFSEQQKELGELNGYIEETLSGMRVIKAYSMERETGAHFQQVNHRLNQAGIRAQIYSGVIPPLMNAVNNLSFAVVAVAGGVLVVQNMITVGLVATFTGFSRQFSRPISELANLYNVVQSAIAGAERVFEVMDEVPEFEGTTRTLASSASKPSGRNSDETGTKRNKIGTIRNETGTIRNETGTIRNSTGTIRGEVEFRDVSFSYVTDVPVLKHINLKADPGHTIALVGPTG